MGNRHFISTTVLVISTLASSAYGETLYIRASAARLRSSPSLAMDDTIVGRVGQNRPVEVLERKTIPGKGSWLRIKSGGKEGWINAKITSKVKTTASTTSAAPAPVVKPVSTKPAPQVAAAPKPVAPKSADKTPKTDPPAPKAETAREPVKKAPEKAAEKPAPTKVAKPEPTKTEPAKTEPAKTPKKNNLPVVDPVAADNSQKCITEIGQMTKEQAEILSPLLKSGELHNDWKSPRGAQFSLNDHGRIVVTLHALPSSTVKAIVKGTNFSEQVIKDALANGVIQFNGTICKKGESYAINLEGTGMATNGMKGYLALLPNGKGGFKANGEIAKSKFAENFSAAGSAQ